MPIEKVLTLQNVIILIKSILNEDKNHYYYEILLEKFLYQLAEKYSQKFCTHYKNAEIWRDKSKKRKGLMLQKNE